MSGRALDIDGLYKTEEQIAAALGIGVDSWRATALVLERHNLPPRDPLFGKRRYWPAVKAFLDRRAGLDAPSVLAPDGEENFTREKRNVRGRSRVRETATG